MDGVISKPHKGESKGKRVILSASDDAHHAGLLPLSHVGLIAVSAADETLCGTAYISSRSRFSFLNHGNMSCRQRGISLLNSSASIS